MFNSAERKAVKEIVDELEHLEAQDATPDVLDRALSSVTDIDTLWQIAELAAPEIRIFGALYRRALTIGASADTARGYLALAHLFQGDDQSALALVGATMPVSADPVLLDAWSALSRTSAERLERLKGALAVSPNSLRLWRACAAEALRTGELGVARKAHEWLATHETNPREVKRVRGVMKQYGWA